MIHYDLLYDGPHLQWPSQGIFRATSGVHSRQYSAFACDPTGGPIPEGSYFFMLGEEPAVPVPTPTCQIPAAWQIQRIPSGADAGACAPYWALWGKNRVRLNRMETSPRSTCAKPRDGFYIHDSGKGYTHGCIEVEPRFFEVLRHVVATMHSSHGKLRDRLYLLVKYLPGQSTYGGTYGYG